MSPRTKTVIKRIEASKALDLLLEGAVNRAIIEACLGAPDADPMAFLLSFLANNLEENDEHPELHGVWIAGADCCDIAEHFLRPAIDAHFAAVQAEEATIRSIQRAEV